MQHPKDKRNENTLYGHLYVPHIHYRGWFENNSGWESEDCYIIHKKCTGICMISGFFDGVSEIFSLLRFYAAMIDS
jgi:hypothetical protein